MKGKSLLKALTGAYFLTLLLLLAVAFLLFRFDLGEKMVGACITAVYILSCFFGGYLAGRNIRHRKFLWGATVGIAYFLLLTAASCLIGRGSAVNFSQMLFTLLLCTGGGVLGGMFA